MHLRGTGLTILAALVTCATHLHGQTSSAQYQPPSQNLRINAKTATTWTADRQSVVQLDGPVTIEMERAKLSADRAVVWLSESRNGQPGEQTVTVALLGNAKIEQPGVTRTDHELIIDGRVNGPIHIAADNKPAGDLSNSATYRQAIALRQRADEPAPASRPLLFPTTSATRPATKPAGGFIRRPPPVHFRADNTETTHVDGNIAVVLSGNVALTAQQPDGQFIQMQAQRAVLFTPIQSLREAAGQQVSRPEDAVESAYLEGDVRVSIVPPQAQRAEMRLQAERVFYDFTTDRAVLTDAVLHTIDPQRGIPIIVRAKTIKQLSDGEFRTRKAELTTSSFAVPSYSIHADKAYVREEPTGDDRYGNRVTFVGNHITFNAFRTPFFYLPAVAGSFTERGFPLRDIQMGSSSKYGTYFESEWGVFETLGKVPPQNLDLSFHADYLGDRGPATGLDGKYGGGFISPTSRQAYNFEGEFESYFVWDDGEDILGRKRGHIPAQDEVRGFIDWKQQTFLPNDWQLQLRGGWVSDATFLEEWFEDDFNNGLPMETSLYLKRQRDSEAITLLATLQTNNIVTSADLVQEQFEIERLPQLGYHRIGDSFADDKLTFFSDNALERVRFNVSGASLEDQGYRYGRDVRPGRPSLGLVGVDGLSGPPAVGEDFNNRGDFRQEIDYPIQLGRVKAMPYVVGRYTGYSDSPDGSRADRAFAGTGVRFNTQFWKVDNKPESELFDIHRVRHIIEPEVHAWTGVTNVDTTEVFIYDEPIDRVYDVSAVQLALRQRWQTKRGGPGRWRSVDFLSLNVEANFFGNQPSDAELAPLGFRGIFFPSMPELSTPRNSINADASWRMSDTTIMVSDAQQNLDEMELATASIGMIAQRDPRVSYYLGLRYIDELDSSIGTVSMGYQMTPKYSIGVTESIDFGDSSNIYSYLSFSRKFDRFFMMFTVYNNADSGENGFGFALYPEGLAAGVSGDQLSRLFGGGK